MFFQHLDRKDDVLRRHRLAVVPARFLAQAIDDPGKIIGMLGGFGEQAIFGRDLVLRPRHQRFVDQPDRRRDRAFDARHRDVEIVEGAECESAARCRPSARRD